MTGAAPKREDQGGMRKKVPKITLEEICRQMDSATLRDYPNPQRIGCSSQATLESFARDPKSFSFDDPIFDHLAHCAPCLRLVLAARTRT